MKKPFLLLYITVLSYCAHAQITYLTDTAFTTDVGYNGAPASCIYTGGNTYGISVDGGYWVADLFTIPTGEEWTFDTVTVFVFQDVNYDSATFALFPFQAGYLQIYGGGAPGLGGTVIWGNSTSNILGSTAFTGIFRVDTGSALYAGLTSTYRAIIYLELYLSPAPHLLSGTYWLAWSALPFGMGGHPRAYCPPKVLPGRINPSDQKGASGLGGVWTNVIDNGDTLGFNKIIKGSYAVAGDGVTNINKPLPTALSQNVPNPFSGCTTLSFYMPQAGYAKLTVYNTIGQLVATLADGVTNAGAHNVVFNANGYAAGVYYYRLSTDEGMQGREMLLVK